MNNTFWTLIDNEYYRVHDKILKHAPLNTETNSIESSQESKVEVIAPIVIYYFTVLIFKRENNQND